VNCLSCNHPPEDCQCLQELARSRNPATVVKGAVKPDPERCSAIWIREDPQYGPPFLTVFLEPGPKASVDDVRLAVGALVRWKNAVNSRAQKPFTEDAALEAVLSLYDEFVRKRGPSSRGIHVAVAEEINARLGGLLRENAHDVSLLREAEGLRSEEKQQRGVETSSLDEAIRHVIVARFEKGDVEAARYNSGLGGAIAESYLRALGYSPDAAAQIRERATDDILLGREPFAPEYPADRRRARECVRKARRRSTSSGADRG